MEVRMRMGILVGLGGALAFAAASATDASAGCRRHRVCGGYSAAPVYQYAPPPPVYYAPLPGAYYGSPPVQAGYGYAPPAYGYAPVAGYNGYRNCNRGYGYNGYGNGGYGYGAYGYGYRYAPPAAYDDDDYRPAAVWVPVR
jgi:hypothetical protein